MRELKIQLINEYVGVLNISKDDPIDINELPITIKRSSKNDGVMFSIVFDLAFIKGAREFCIKCFQFGGIDAKITVNVYQSNPNNNRNPWSIYFSGISNLSKYEVDEDKVTFNVEQIGLQRDVDNGLTLDVDLETIVSENGTSLPPINKVDDLVLHAKDILKKAGATSDGNLQFQQLDVIATEVSIGNGFVNRDDTAYGQFDLTKQTTKELDGFFTNPFGWTRIATGTSINNNLPATDAMYRAFILANKTPRFETYKALEAGVADIDISLTFKHSVEVVRTGGNTNVQGLGNSDLGYIEITAWYEHRDSDDVIKLLEKIGAWNMTRTNQNNDQDGSFETKTYQKNGVVIDVGDKIYVYELVRIYGRYEEPNFSKADLSHIIKIKAGDETQGATFVNITQRTTSPSTKTKAILAFEAVQRCVQYITNIEDCFKSSLLGRTDLGYSVDGDLALIAFTNGHNIRGRNTKQIFTNLQEMVDFFDAIGCVGIGYETDSEGVERLVLEYKEYFYNKNLKSLSFKGVYDIKEKLLPSRYFNSVEFGYSTKVDIGQINSIDEFNTLRRHTEPLRNSKNKLQITTKLIAGGYQIENQRRLSISTKDSKLDEANFVIVVIRDSLTYKSKRNEGYEYINNVYSPETIYNVDISPARCLLRWRKVLASNLIFATRPKISMFAFGEVNYEMVSKKIGEQPVYENGDVDLTYIEPIWENTQITCSVPMSREEFRLYLAGIYGYVELFDKDNKVYNGFVDDDGTEYDGNKGIMDFKLLKVFRPN